LDKKRVKVIGFGGEIEAEGCEVREPLVDTRKEKDCLISDFEREFNTVGDGEKLFGDDGERLQSAVVAVEEFNDPLP
jgi:hypothetical protein